MTSLLVTSPERPFTKIFSKSLAVLVFVFSAALFLRNPTLLLSPRFWDEEGHRYYALMQDHSFFESMRFVENGSYVLLTNLSVYLSTLVPAYYAPYVTAALSLLASFIMVACLGTLLHQQRVPFQQSCLAVVLVALLPHGYEIFATSLNIQWIACATLMLISVLDLTSASRLVFRLIVLLTIFFGMTGVPPVLVAPVFLMRRWIVPSPRHFKLGLLLSAFALVQILVIMSHQQSHMREGGVSLFIVTAPALLQGVLANFIGLSALEVYAFFGMPDRTFAQLLFPMLLSASILYVVVTGAWNAKNQRLVVSILLFLWFWLAALGSIGAYGQKYLVAGTGSRYFFASSIAFIVFVILAAQYADQKTVRIARIMLAIMVVNGVVAIFYSPSVDYLKTGPSWAAEVERCGEVRPCRVAIWPADKPSFLLRRQ